MPPALAPIPPKWIAWKGSDPALTVAVSGSIPQTNVWKKDGTIIEGEQNTRLRLTQVDYDDQGTFSFEVSNAFGSARAISQLVVSQVALLGSPNASVADLPGDLNHLAKAVAGPTFGVALKNDGILMTWGSLPPGSVPPVELADVATIAAGGDFFAALSEQGTVRAWGNTNHTQVPPNLSNVVAIACGREHGLALCQDGRVVGWGDNQQNQLPVPGDLREVVSVACGNYHNLALTRQGQVIAWGNNNRRQCEVPNDLEGVVQISAGGDYSMALDRLGRITWWGNGHGAKTNLPATISQANAIAVGGNYALVHGTSGLHKLNLTTSKLDSIPVPDETIDFHAAFETYLALVPEGTETAVRLEASAIETGGFKIHIHTKRGRTHLLESAETIETSEWKIQQVLLGNGQEQVLEIVPKSPGHFYRIRVP